MPSLSAYEMLDISATPSWISQHVDDADDSVAARALIASLDIESPMIAYRFKKVTPRYCKDTQRIFTGNHAAIKTR